MSKARRSKSVHKRLIKHGLTDLKDIHRNYPTAKLYEEAIRRNEVVIAPEGPMIAWTGSHTGRSPNDKYVVKEPATEDNIWWGKVNVPIDERLFSEINRRIAAYYQGREAFVQDCYAGADPNFQVPVRVITEYAWHSLFARNMFIPCPPGKDEGAHKPRFTVIQAPGFHPIPDIDGLRSKTAILVHVSKGIVLICGTMYAGEIKKSVFSILNYVYPEMDVFPMHASANIGPDGDTAVFFGLSATGKTTLSADPDRSLIGDDEHGWSKSGVFNFEGGCYAKVIKLSAETEPEIYATTKMFGTILENIIYDDVTRELDFNADDITENTRASYPLDFIPNTEPSHAGGHPKNVVMLTADAFGVLPPISRLTPEQAMFHFISGYTAKVAGTERGIDEPQATFSACFGAPFLPRHPGVYAKMLGEKLKQHKTHVWLINTGWTGGPYGEGERMSLPYTRAMLSAALAGDLDEVEYTTDPNFRLEVPKTCPGVPDAVLNQRGTWKDPKKYDEKAKHLAELFKKNIKKFINQVDPDVRAMLKDAGPA